MPYTKDSEANPRSNQIEVPKNIGEYTLALTTLGLEYIKKNGESYAHYTHCMNAFMPGDEGSICRFNYEHIDDAIKLREMANWITQNYKNRVQGTPKEHEVTGARMCCMLEFYRRMVEIYEGKKIKENGDVFPEKSFESFIVDMTMRQIVIVTAKLDENKKRIEALEKRFAPSPKVTVGFGGKKAKKIDQKEEK